MLKKTILAIAAVVGLAGLAGLADTAPAAAQPVQHRFPMAQGAHPGRPMGPRPAHVIDRRFGNPGAHRPPMHVGHRPPRDDWRRRDWHRRHHHDGGRWVGGVWIVPPGLYGYDDGYVYDSCRIVRKRVRVLTDDGWRLRWRRYRICD